MKLLLVEDDKRISQSLAKGLIDSGYQVTQVFDGLTAYKQAAKEQYDIGIIDIMLPGMDGLTLLKKLRDDGQHIPLLVLSAKNTTEDIIKGIQNGGDDYMVKPFSFSELQVRLQALLRRSQQIQTFFRCGELSVDVSKQEVIRAGVAINLQPLEYALLVYLICNQNRTISKTMIMKNVWNYHFDSHSNIVESRICKLREKIDAPFSCPYLHTERGQGYSLRSRDVR